MEELKTYKKNLRQVQVLLVCLTMVIIFLLFYLGNKQTDKIERDRVALLGVLIQEYHIDQREALQMITRDFNQDHYDIGFDVVNNIINYQKTKTEYTFFYIISGTMSLTMVLVYFLYKKHIEMHGEQLQKLIEESEHILKGDKEHLLVIDGEDNISVLSNKLYMLNERYYTLLQNMTNEKLKLKDYIEDITHQIKTPITSMRLNEELLLNTTLTDKQRTKVEDIYKQTTKITELVDALLRLAKIESRSVQFTFTNESVFSILSEVENILEPLLISQQVIFQIEGNDCFISCDHTWMVEALENILKNSIEIKGQDVIHIKIEENDSFVYIHIQDHGPGFKEEDLEHIFDRFYRIDNANTIGVGIGLALTKEIITLHHGMIEAKNHDGACFIITLPKIYTKNKYAVTE